MLFEEALKAMREGKSVSVDGFPNTYYSMEGCTGTNCIVEHHRMGQRSFPVCSFDIMDILDDTWHIVIPEE